MAHFAKPVVRITNFCADKTLDVTIDVSSKTIYNYHRKFSYENWCVMRLSVKNRLIISYMLFYIAYMSFFPYVNMYLALLGYGQEVIALVSTATATVNFLIQFYIGKINRRLRSSAASVKLLLLFSAISTFMLYMFHDSIICVILSVLPVTMLDFSVIGQLDSYTANTAVKESEIKYSTMRAIAAFSGAVSSTFFGKVYTVADINYMFTVHTIMIVMTLLSVMILPSDQFSEIASENHKILMESGRNEHMFWLLLYLGGGLIFTGWRANITYLPILLLNHGGNTAHQGMAMALNSLSCVPVLLIYPMIRKKITNRNVLSVGSLFMVVRLMCVPLLKTANMIVILQLLEALSYGLLQPAIMEILTVNTNDENRAGLIAVWTGIQMALCTISANIVISFTTKLISLESSFVLFAVLALTGMIIINVGISKRQIGD